MNKQIFYFFIDAIHLMQVMGQWICKEFQRFVVWIHCYSLIYVTFHRMWITIIAYHSKWFVWSKQAVCTAKSLDNIFILHQLIHIERINPFGIKACKHLIHHYEKIDLLVLRKILSIIRLFMGKTQSYIFLESCMSWHRKFFAKLLFVAF